MGIQKFEELDCWKAARQIVTLVYDCTSKEPFSRNFGLRDQIQRAAVSTMANIAEGFGNYSNPEFIRFLGYSIRSCFEVESHLYVAMDLNYISSEDFKKMYDKIEDCINLCKGFIKYLKG